MRVATAAHNARSIIGCLRRRRALDVVTVGGDNGSTDEPGLADIVEEARDGTDFRNGGRRPWTQRAISDSEGGMPLNMMERCECAAEAVVVSPFHMRGMPTLSCMAHAGW